MVWWLRYFHWTKDKKEREMRGKNIWGRQCKILSCKCSGLRWIQMSWWHHPELSLLWSHSAKHKTLCFAPWREQASRALALTGGAKVVKKRRRGTSQTQKYWILEYGWNIEHGMHLSWMRFVQQTSFQDCSVDLSESNSYDAKPKHRDQQGPTKGCWISLPEWIISTDC